MKLWHLLALAGGAYFLLRKKQPVAAVAAGCPAEAAQAMAVIAGQVGFPPNALACRPREIGGGFEIYDTRPGGEGVMWFMNDWHQAAVKSAELLDELDTRGAYFDKPYSEGIYVG